jgi:hypothetical protein
MTARKSILGLSLLAVFALAAIAARGASAAWQTATNTTAFTCVAGGAEDFSDSHCDNHVEPGAGSFGHVEIAKSTQTDIEAVGVGTLRLKSRVAGLKVNIACNKARTDPTPTSFIEDTGSGTTHRVEGTIALLLEECKEEGELAALGCEVDDPITLKSFFHGAEEPVSETMALKFTSDIVRLAEIFYESGCLVGEGPFELKGSAIGTPGGATPNQRWSGATVKFEPGNEMEALTFAGEKAEFEATFTVRMEGGNPIALTTPTG